MQKIATDVVTEEGVQNVKLRQSAMNLSSHQKDDGCVGIKLGGKLGKK